MSTVETKKDATFGAKAFDPGTDKLPGVFPREMGPNTMTYLQEVVDSGLASNMYDRFTTCLAEMYGVRYAMGTPGCTQAVLAAMLGMDFDPGAEIICSPIADYGTVAGMLFEGYIPVFADTDPGTALISAATIEPLVTPRTRAIMCVHKLGLPCDMGPINALAKKHDLVVITDVCQAILSEYQGSRAATLGDLGCFSFDAEKTCGADIGGAVVTDNEEIFSRITNRAIARGAYQEPGFGRIHSYRGFAIRMPQCTAATCLANLEIVEEQIENRQKMAAMLDEMIGDIDGIIPYAVPSDRTHTYWMYGFSVDPTRFSQTADEIAMRLKDGGIPGVGMGRYYLMPAAMPFLADQAAQREYPYSLHPNVRYSYGADTVPNAKAFLDTWIRWFWTEKYRPAHIEHIASIIRSVAESSSKKKTA